MSEGDGAPLERFPSGIPGVDTILNGGFFKNGVYIIQGAPGSGKTIFGNQLCFNHVRAGGRAIYITLLSESHSRMLLNIRTLRFYDEAAVPESIYYVSGFKVLEDEGLKALVDLIRREVRAHRSSLLVLDGLVAAGETAQSDREFKKFIHEVQLQATMLNCTTFLLTNGSGKPAHPEHTMVDGLIDLSDHHFEGRVERELIIRKFRGSSMLLGRHTFRISDEGIVLYPRIEALLARPSAEDGAPVEKIGTGVEGLDEMLRGGLWRGTTTMILGPSGVGKTTLGLHFLSQSTVRQPGLLFGFYETPESVLRRADSLGLDLRKLVANGAVEILWQPATENHLDALGLRLLEAVRRRSIHRLFIDGLGGFEDTAFFPQRVARFFTALANEFRIRGVTTLYTSEMGNVVGRNVDLPRTRVSPIVENLILLRYVELGAKLYRLLSVVKVRDGDYDSSLREFAITGRGIDLSNTFESADAILTGGATTRTTKIVRKTKQAKRPRRGRRK